jgi:hypothetical protein
MSSGPGAPEGRNGQSINKPVATDGGRDGPFYVVDEDRGAVVAGPYVTDDEARDDARERGPAHIVTTEGVLELIEATAATTVRWETDDVDLVTDGGVIQYRCDDCGPVNTCNVDDNGQRRCPDCGRVVTTVATDGGTRRAPRGQSSLSDHVYAGDTLAGVADQDNTCKNGEEGCPGPEGDDLPCFECFMEGST